MAEGQRTRRSEADWVRVGVEEETFGGSLAEISASARAALDEAAEVMEGLDSGDAEAWLNRARQRGGQ